MDVEHADHSRIVAERGDRGYVQHSFVFRGHEFAHRTYFFHGVAYDRFYRRYKYHGVYLDIYATVRYYPSALYTWVSNSWAASVPYNWGWAGNRWYARYGFYFAPYPSYPSASQWLTDYLISSTLAAAYQAQVDAGLALGQGNSAGGGPMLTPGVKQVISEEVLRQIKLENVEAQTTARNAEPDPHASGVDRMIADGALHIFVAGRDLDLTGAGGEECAVSEGDVFELSPPASSNATAANLMVLASKGGRECRRGSTVSIAFVDLQDMQNHMRETLDLGLADLESHQGQGSLPAEPPAAKAAPVQAAFAANAPSRTPNVANQIRQQDQEADKAEKETLGQLAAVNRTPASEISRGQTVDEVTAALGAPTKILDLGTKKIYVFDDIKVTFTADKVSDVQ